MSIEWSLTTLNGYPLAGEVTRIGADRADGTVTRPLQPPGRTASVSVSLFDPIVPLVKPLAAILTARYFGQIVFAGVVQIPEHGTDDDTLTLNAQDPSRRLDAAPLIDPRIIYSSLDQLIESARPRRYGWPDAPDHGVKAQPGASAATQPPFTGLDTAWRGSLAPGRGPFPRLDVAAGASVWSVMTAASESVFGPEFTLRPIEHVPGTWDYTTLDLGTRLGRELQDDPAVQFHYGWGQSNCAGAGYAPGGDRVVNAYFQELAIEGDTSDDDAGAEESIPTIEGYYSPDEINALGFYAGYEGSSGCTGAAGSAIAQVAAYRAPPRFFTIQPAIEGVDGDFGYVGADGQWVGGLGVPPRYGRDYDVGDTIALVVHRGYFRQRLVGRITNAELKEVDAAGNVQVTLECVPRVDILGILRDTTEFATGVYTGFPGDLRVTTPGTGARRTIGTLTRRELPDETPDTGHRQPLFALDTRELPDETPDTGAMLTIAELPARELIDETPDTGAMLTLSTLPARDLPDETT